MKFTIKNLSHAHLDDVMEIEKLSYGEHHWSRDSFVSELQSDITRYICAENEAGRCVGYTGMWHILDEGHITTLAVHPDYRKKGLAQALVIGSLDRCLENNIKYITLEVRISNEKAINIYEKFGFRSLGLRKKYYQNNGEDALIMWTEDITSENFQTLYNNIREELLKTGIEISES
jgi:ribosomal-protein-alanine N-acetyltransferase